MWSLLIVGFVLLSYYIASGVLSLRKNIKIAAKINLPYVVVPLYTARSWWYFCYHLVLPALRKLPERWTYPWLDFLDPYWSWTHHHKPFDRLGNDTIVVVSPGGLIVCTCDPNVIVEVANRRDDFCKPVEAYAYLDQRILAPTFTEQNAELVWKESIRQSEQMLKSWLVVQSAESPCILDIRQDTMKLPFHVLNRAGFGIDREALHALISHLFHIFISPSWLLRYAPFAYTKHLHMAERAILANVFLMMIAGQETTATTLLLTLVELAINIEWQQEVQKDLDRIFGQRPHDQWDLRKDVGLLSGGKVGATINEVLRLYPPVNIIPKGTRAGSPQTLRSGPEEFTVPENTPVQILTVSAHYNPKYWRAGAFSSEGKDDLDDFRPQRWFPNANPISDRNAVMDDSGEQNGDAAAKNGILGSETSASLIKPYPGTYIPFSIGHRGCIGRRFAQVELFAVIAVILKDYSLELDVRKFAHDEAVDKMNSEEREKIYKKARAETSRVTREGIRHHLTMQLKAGTLALRLVKRGEERFFG